MCGRYASSRRPEDLVEEFEVDQPVLETALEPDFNVAPTKDVYAVLERPANGDERPEPERQLRVLRWGLVPSWAKDPTIGNRMINARVETVAEKPAYKRAFAKRRCLLPADGYFEWYPTEQQTVEAANFYSVEDLGRRGLNGDGSTGPLDNFDSSNTNHTTVSFSFYDRKKKQWLFFYPDGASRTTTSMAFGLDFQIGEPGAGERQADYETHTRPLWHSIKTPATNAWFVGMYQHGDIIVGVTADGQTWTVNSGLNDLASVAIEDHWDTPEFDGGDPTRTKCFRLLLPLTEDRGNWNLDIQYALDGSTEFSDAYSFIQASTGSSFIGTGTVGTATIGEGGRATGASYLELNGRTLRLRFKNQRLSEDWLMAAFSHQYQMGSMQL